MLRGIALAVERIGQVPKYQPGLGRIIVVTDGRFASDDDELVVTLMAQVQALGIQLDVFGVNTVAPEPVGEQTAVLPLPDSREKIGFLVASVSGRMLAVEDAATMISSLHAKAVKQVHKYRGALSIANVVNIPVCAYGYTAEAKMPVLSRMVAPEALAPLAPRVGVDHAAAAGGMDASLAARLVATTADGDGHVEDGADVGAGDAHALQIPGVVNVKSERRLFRDDEAGRRVELAPYDTASGYRYAQQ